MALYWATCWKTKKKTNKNCFSVWFSRASIAPCWSCLSQGDKIWVRIDHWDGSRWENSVQVETSQPYASQRTAFWRRLRARAQTPAGLTPLQAWRRRKTKMKREGLLGRQRQNCRKDGAGGARTRRAPPAYLDANTHISNTHTHTHSASILQGGRLYEPAVTTLLNTIDDKSVPTSELLKWFPPSVSLSLSLFNKHRHILEVTRMLLLRCETRDAMFTLSRDLR